MANIENTNPTWKRRPSEIRGYERAMYTTLDNGDYIRVDYNTGEKIARLYVEVMKEKGAAYYSVVNKGKVTVEKNNNGRPARVADVISERAEDFSSLPNNDVLKIINNNYGISKKESSLKNLRQERIKIERQEIKRKYFRDEENPYKPGGHSSQRQIKKIGIIDLVDTLTGILICIFFFFMGQYDLMAAGITAIIWGMLLGVFDILLREREPVFLKIVFFLISGIGSYLYGYIYL